MLGILIGVTAVIWLVALGEGVSYQAQQQIKELGATNIILKSAKPSSGSSAGSSFIVEYGLTRADFDRIVQSVPTIERAVPMRESKSNARVGSRDADVQLIGCTSSYKEINNLQIARGRYLSDKDLEEKRNSVVLAAETATQLFGYENPLGSTIEINVNNRSDVYVVIGVTQDRMPSASIGSSFEGRDYNLDVYIPLSTFRERIGDQIITARSGSREGELVQLSQITLTVGDVSQVQEAADIIGILLKKYHPNEDYTMTVPQELLRQAEMLRMMFNVLLIVIAGISLLVGGIGIMNIMLATVTERTREIGVRRSLGANQQDIIVQFLSETIVLSGLGGLLGLLFGFLCKPVTRLVLSLIESWFDEVWRSLPPTIQNLQPIVAGWSIFASVGISVFVGVVFGIYPAIRAAKMDPIEALRHH
ncbi:MAG: ABC transporter substrate-binding protein [Planctomycetaceae bacterium]|nr:ABC transporter substrate-binding protein [Planctomycetaceae bacterium]